MIDISNLTYKELEELEKTIAFKKANMKQAEYTGFVKSVENTIKSLISEGFGPRIAIRTYCEDCDEENEISWDALLCEIERAFMFDY